MGLLKRLPPGSGRWLLLAAIVLPFAGMRILKSLQSDEEQIKARLFYAFDAVETRRPRRIGRFLARDFTDSATGYGRRDVLQWANGLLVPGERYRASLREDAEDGTPGFQITHMSEPDERPRTATIAVRCRIERRHKDTEFEPWWDLDFTGLMVRDGGVWKLQRTEDVNHENRPRH